MGFTVFRGLIGLFVGTVVICSLVIASIVGAKGQDQGPSDYYDCMYWISDDDPNGSATTCKGTIGVSVISLFWGILVLITLFFTNVRLGIFSLVSGIVWTIVWLILAAYITAGWNETCDTVNDCEAFCDAVDTDYDALNSTIAMAWITCGCWLLGSVFLWLARKD